MMSFIPLILLIMFSQTLTWFQSNSQFIWPSWEDKPLLSVLVFGVPSCYLFWYVAKYGMASLHSAWDLRFLIFGLSYVSFPILTSYFMHEELFSKKNIVSFILSMFLIMVQYFWRSK